MKLKLSVFSTTLFSYPLFLCVNDITDHRQTIKNGAQLLFPFMEYELYKRSRATKTHSTLANIVYYRSDLVLSIFQLL